MLTKMTLLLVLLMTLGGLAQAAPSRESDTIDAQPIVMYGKDTNGVLRAAQVDSDGVLQVG